MLGYAYPPDRGTTGALLAWGEAPVGALGNFVGRPVRLGMCGLLSPKTAWHFNRVRGMLTYYC